MLSIAPVVKANLRYQQELSVQEYKQEGGERPGYWLGRGAQMLDLWVRTATGRSTRQMDAATFDSLADGVHPATGEPLRAFARTRRAKDANEQGNDLSADTRTRGKIGWDLTLSCPKDVSILWGLGDEPTQRAVEQAHRRAVMAAVEFMESAAFVSRRGTTGSRAEKVGAVIAAFEHGTSRVQDPQLHTHLIVFNVGLRDDGTWGALRSRDFYVYRKAIDAIYMAELATGIRTSLRIPLESSLSRTGFAVQKMGQRLREAFSRRSQMIEAQLVEWEKAGGISAKLAALATRHRKSHVAQETLRKQWRGVADALYLDVERLYTPTLPPLKPDVEYVKAQTRMQVAAAVKMFANAMGVAREPEIIAEVAQRCMLMGVSSATLRGFISESLTTHPDIYMVKRAQAAFPEYTSRQLIETEQQLLKHAAKLASQSRRPLVLQAPNIVFPSTWRLNKEQREALAYITDRASDLKCINGVAGSGKTTLLKAAGKIFSQMNNDVLGLCVTGQAALNLYTGAGIPTRTVAMLLEQIRQYEKQYLPRGPHPFAKSPVLIVDEASLLGSVDAEELFRYAAAWDARVVLVGDTAQLPSIPTGGCFERLCNTHGCKRLKTIVRQKYQWMRDAVTMASEGDVRGAFSAYAERGLLHIAADKEAAIDRMVKRYVSLSGPFNYGTIMLAATNEEVSAINLKTQLAMKKERPLNWLYATDKRGRRFNVEDRVMFAENEYRQLNIRNGELGTILNIEHGPLELVGRHAIVEVQLDTRDLKDNIRTVRVPLDKYESLQLGYAMTTHKAQGTTSPHALVLIDAAHTSREQFYVEISRHKSHCELFTDINSAGEDCCELSDAINRSTRKQLVHDSTNLKVGDTPHPTKVHPVPIIETTTFKKRAQEIDPGGHKL